jgi:hypothetical protein
MTQTEMNRTARTADGRDREHERTSRPSAKVLTSTETRRSFMTTEFWIALAMAAALVIVGYADDDGLGVSRAWELAAGVIGIYILSRGIAKAGSRDPQVRDLDDYR